MLELPGTAPAPAGVTIRPFDPGDQVPARRLILEGLGEHFGVIDETCNPDIDDIAGHYPDRGHVFLVAEYGAELVATGALVCEDQQTGQLVRVSVVKRWRRQGLGRTLVQRLIAAARDRKLARLWMETNDDWIDAIALYSACGFEEFDRCAGNIYMALDLTRNRPPHSCVQ